MKQTNSSSLLRAHSRGSFSRLLFESEHSNGGGHSDRSIAFRLCQLLVLVFRLVTPFSYIFLTTHFVCDDLRAYLKINAISYGLLLLWFTIEAVFFPYYLYLFNYLTKSKSNLKHVASCKDSRFKFLQKFYDAQKHAAGTGDKVQYMRKALEGWFLGTPIANICRQNVEAWACWVFFERDIHELTQDELTENEAIVDYMEQQLVWKFEPGKNEELYAARLTLDPVFATQRPFFFYSTMVIVNYLVHAVLYVLGFRKRKDFSSSAQSIYHRPARENSRSAFEPVGKPIVFVHGIGIGFAHYLPMIARLPTEVDVYLIEWPHVAMQLATEVPTVESSVDAIIRVMKRDQHRQACFVAHSLGCAAVSWMLRDPEGCLLVASTVLLEPVTLMLCDPKVATAFIYNDPQTEIDFLMHFFLSRELCIANALSRHFSWSRNMLFVEDLSAVDRADDYSYAAHASSKLTGPRVHNPAAGGSKLVKELKVSHTIFLAAADTIVPTPVVGKYLQGKAKEGHTCFEVVMFRSSFGGHHGELFLWPRWVRLLISKVRERCNLPSSKHSSEDTVSVGSNANSAHPAVAISGSEMARDDDT